MIGVYLAEHGGGCFILVLGSALMLAGPIGILVVCVYLLRRPASGPREGFFFGITIAMWASVSELFVPYCGLYPSLPGVVLAQQLRLVEPWQLETVVHVVNFTLWPVLGWFAFFVRQRLCRPA